MCSISGVVFQNDRIQIERYLEAFDLLQHRGPDDQGIVAIQNNGAVLHCKTDQSTAIHEQMRHIRSLKSAKGLLGHHRLSILDLSGHGHQPMERDGCILIYNGEVYNYKEIREELQRKGYEFTSKTDTEVVLTAYLHYGTECFCHFNGMWALAIYDLREKKIILSRDRFGIKPLYYSLNQKGLAFASELKFFYKLDYRSTNADAARDYLIHCRMDHGNSTMIDHVDQLPPARFLEYSLPDHQYQLKSYWKLEKKFRLNDVSDSDVIDQISQIFTSCVELRLRSDVGVGVLLSGGLDSTGVLGKMLQLTDENRLFYCYSSVFPDSDLSEHDDINRTLSLWQKRVAPVFVEYGPNNIEENIQKLLYYQDTPFRSLSVLSQYLIYQRIAIDQNATVFLNGQGADELFGGYTGHLYANLTAKMMACDIKGFWKESISLRQWMTISWLNIFIMMAKNAKRTLKAQWTDRNMRGLNALGTLLYTNLMQTALPEYLRYEDRNSMASSKESRLPFLDFRLVEFVWSLKDELKIRQGTTKWSLRESLKDSIPSHIYDFRGKRGFISPHEEWQESGPLKNWVEERIAMPSILTSGDWSRISSKLQNDPWQKWRLALFNEWENGSYKTF